MNPFRKRHQRFFFVLAFLLFCIPLAGCQTHIAVETVIATPEPEQATEAPTATPEPTVSPVPSPTQVPTPEKFVSEEMLPQEESQIINPKKATYERFGIDREAKKAFEAEVSQALDLPIMNVSTLNQEHVVSRTEYLPCIIDVFNCPENWTVEEASAGIRVRGNSSGYYGDVEKILQNQVPYRLKFDKKTSLLGLNSGAKCKSWVLLKANYDLIRNDLALRFGRTIMNGHAFCSDACFIHLYVNDAYIGVYTLCEQCQVDEHRVNVTEAKKNYTGIDIGYYVEIDNKPDYPMAFPVDYGKHRAEDIEGTVRQFAKADYSVKSDIYTQGQIDFIAQYVANVFEIVYQACEKGKFYTLDENFDLITAPFSSAQETVENVLDMESVVNMYLLYEIMHDYDVGEGSFYMCVDFSENSACRKLQFTSPWDFNWTCEGSASKYWACTFSEPGFVGKNGDRTNPWFVLLVKQDWFHRLAAEKWTALSETNAINGCIDQEINLIEVYRKDFTFWKRSSINNAYDVIVWLKKRIKWMDGQFLLSTAQ